jgi:hypothetical protein
MRSGLMRPPGSVVSELRRDLRRLGVVRTARLWAVSERTALLTAAGLRVPRAAVAAGLRQLLARVEGSDV